MNNTLSTITTAAVGVGSIQIAEAILPSPEHIEIIGKLLIQLAIGVATLFRLLREKRRK